MFGILAKALKRFAPRAAAYLRARLKKRVARHGPAAWFNDYALIDHRRAAFAWRWRTGREIHHERKRERWQRKVRYGNAFSPSPRIGS